MLAPRTVALIGASSRAGALGETVMRNLLRAEFSGTILPVNPRYRSVHGVWCHRSVQDLPEAPDLAVLCTPPATVVPLIEQLAERGAGAAVVMTAGSDVDGSFRAAVAEVAHRTGLRVLGPGSAGLQAPHIGLNASLIATRAVAGRLALVSQSAAMTGGVVEWATVKGIGFSHVVSVGDTADVDLGEIFDHLGSDRHSRALLLVLKDLGEARRFMSAGRAIARLRPVVTLIADNCGGEDSVIFPSGEILPGVSEDAVHDAAIRRAGMLRIGDTDELLAAAETLAAARPISGERIAIIGNGSVPGAFAAAIVAGGGGHLARLSEATTAKLRALPGTIVTAGGVDLGRDADPARFAEGIELLLRDPEAKAVMVLHVTTARAAALSLAKAVAEAAAKSNRTVLACCLGGADDDVRRILAKAKIPVFTTPERAARAFLHLINYHRNRDLLVQVPASVAVCSDAERRTARRVIDNALAAGRAWLEEDDAFTVLETYGVPVAPLAVASTPEAAAEAALRLGLPVGLRLSMHGSLHQYPRDDLVADLATPEEVTAAAHRLLAMEPGIASDGRPPRLVVQQLPHPAAAIPLSFGISSHRSFGHVIHVKGAGGRNVVALPPLNMVLAQELLERAGIAEALDSAPWVRPSHRAAAATVLIHLSELAVDVPELATLAVDSLLMQSGMVALDARIAIGYRKEGAPHLAIHPYPRDLVEEAVLADGRRILLRPVRPEDEPGYRAMLARLEAGDVFLRFCQHLGANIDAAPIGPLVHIDYDRQMTFVAELDGEIVGAVELSASPTDTDAEYSVVIRSDMKGCRLGRLLMERIIAYARTKGFAIVFGLVLKENNGMLALNRKLGFTTAPADEGDDLYRLDLRLD